MRVALGIIGALAGVNGWLLKGTRHHALFAADVSI